MCRHINFKYVIDSSLNQIREKIPLASLEWLLEHDKCAFCRLVSSTIRSSLGRDTVPTQAERQDIKCTLSTLPILEYDLDGAREPCIWLSEEELKKVSLMAVFFGGRGDLGLVGDGLERRKSTEKEKEIRGMDKGGKSLRSWDKRDDVSAL